MPQILGMASLQNEFEFSVLGSGGMYSKEPRENPSNTRPWFLASIQCGPESMHVPGK